MGDMQKRTDLVCKIVIIGDAGVGKTCLLRRFTHDEYSNGLTATIGLDFASKHIQVKNKRIQAQIWDTASLEKFQSLTSLYYRGAKAIIIAYDITNRHSFENLNHWISDFKQNAFGSGDMEEIIIGNKCDNEDYRAVNANEGENLAESNGMLFSETSAKDNINVNTVFTKLLERIVSKELRRAENLRKRSTYYNNLIINDDQSTKSCCQAA